jgi:hypothetical protein
LPFGGIKVVTVGDFFQLLPVNEKSIEPKCPNILLNRGLAFESRVWLRLKLENTMKICYLNGSQRLTGSSMFFLTALNKIRDGTISKTHFHKMIEKFNDPAKIDVNDLVKPSYLYPTRNEVNALNNQELRKINGPGIFSRFFYGVDWVPEINGDDDYNMMDATNNKNYKDKQTPFRRTNDENIDSKQALHLKPGSQVMLTINFKLPEIGESKTTSISSPKLKFNLQKNDNAQTTYSPSSLSSPSFSNTQLSDNTEFALSPLLPLLHSQVETLKIYVL